MVRLINKDNSWILKNLVRGFFRFQRHNTYIKNINYPQEESCIFAMWHGHQCALFGLEKIAKTSVMISSSLDGDLVTAGVELLGFNVVRGSTGRKGNIAATIQLIDRLKNNENAALMVDGPRGPARKVKGGVVKIAKATGKPVVPIVWYSERFNFATFPSWDKMTMPIGYCEIISVYGEPIYVDPNISSEDEKLIFQKIEDSLKDLEKRAPGIYKEAKKNKLWKEPYRYQQPK